VQEEDADSSRSFENRTATLAIIPVFWDVTLFYCYTDATSVFRLIQEEWTAFKKETVQHSKTFVNIQCVPLATEPGISLIILTPMKILQMYVRCVRNEKECVCSSLQISLQYPH